MNLLLVHNYYKMPGGEDSVFHTEKQLLIARGHTVNVYTAYNKAIESLGPFKLAVTSILNRTTYSEVWRELRKIDPDLIHVHNTFPLISPSIYYAASAERVPVVQTLHNYRLLCPNALLFRDGRVCEDCLKRFVPWPGVVGACYRGSRAATGVAATMLTVHRVLGTWTRMVSVYIALTEFARQKFIEGGLPAEKIVVKPNFVYPDPGMGEGKGGHALFVGRLSPEKGVRTLLSAWERLETRVPLKVVGDGPLSSEVAEVAQRLEVVEYLGRRPRDNVLALMKQAAFLVFPSEWYEGFPMTIAEAYATGLPVIASNLGSMASLVDHGRTGLHFRPGDPEDLAAKVEWLLSHPEELAEMRKEARAEYEAKYTAERNYEMLLEIYERALALRR